MTARLEHANICVSEFDEIVRFLQTAFPEFRVRGVPWDGANRLAHYASID